MRLQYGLCSTSFASAAQAQSREVRHDRNEVRHDRQELRHDLRRGHSRAEIAHDRRELRQDRHELRHDRRHHHRWRRGQRLDHRYGAWRSVDWRRHHLHRPPRGYHWVRQGDDYVLAALTTGLIASVIAATR